ncbi:MAG: hypothetical protein RL594_88 [Bacteroidota bacterium]|jgi:antitoxin MazE
MRVSKWGNSLAVRLPASIVEELNLKEGDEIELVSSDMESFILHRYDNPAQLLERIRRFRGRLPKGYNFDREGAHER